MIEQKLRNLFPHISEDCLKANAPIQPTESERDHAQALGIELQRKKESNQRITLRYRFFRRRPYDPDNAAASSKTCTDIIRRIGLIPGDDPTQIKLEIEQEKVDSFSNERTEIEIEYPSCSALQSLLESKNRSQSKVAGH